MHTAARCPRCATPTLITSPHSGSTVPVCRTCGGVWLDALSAGQLLAPLGADLQPVAHPGAPPLACPACGAAMQACLARSAGVELDRCTHGVWFDRDELTQVSQSVSRVTGQPMPAAPASWGQAQPPPGAMPGGPGWSSAATAGVAAAGVAAAGVAAYAAFGGGAEEPPTQRSSSTAEDALTYGPDVVNTGTEITSATADVAHEAGVSLTETAGDATDALGEAASATVEVAGDAAEAAGSILGGIFEAIGSIFS